MKTLTVYGLHVAVKKPLRDHFRWTGYVGIDEGRSPHVVHFTDYSKLSRAVRDLVALVRMIREAQKLPVPATIINAATRIRASHRSR